MAGELILVVDDNPQNLKLASVLLRAEEYEVATAVDAEDAMRYHLDEVRDALAMSTTQPRSTPEWTEVTSYYCANPRTFVRSKSGL